MLQDELENQDKLIDVLIVDCTIKSTDEYIIIGSDETGTKYDIIIKAVLILLDKYSTNMKIVKAKLTLSVIGSSNILPRWRIRKFVSCNIADNNILSKLKLVPFDIAISPENIYCNEEKLIYGTIHINYYLIQRN